MTDRKIAFSISVHLMISVESVDVRYSIFLSPSLRTNKLKSFTEGRVILQF